jgi:choice-of-anchor C domain-containing protein
MQIKSCVLTCALCQFAAAGLINGGFESGVDPNSTGVGYVDPGANGIDGWTVIGDVDYVGNWWQSAEGFRSIDLNGESPATIEQWVQTTIGSTYVLSFAMASNPDSGPSLRTLRAFAGDTQQDFTFALTPTTSRTSMGWVYYSLTFVASSEHSRIAFQSMTPGFEGPAIDDVALIPSAPSLSAFIGIACLAARRNRRH